MAGPSTSTHFRSHGRFKYDVFLSFRGEDTRNNFAGLLYEMLKLKGISAFFDEEDLHKGESLETILEAITMSQIFVPIFSKHYAESTWCLREVAKMVECHHRSRQETKIFPVFFDVDPKDVRCQSGPFEDAFQKHRTERRDNLTEVDGWKDALIYVGRITGFHLKNGNQRELMNSITAEIVKVLPTMKRMFEMCDQIGDMGREIVPRESLLHSGTRSRLCCEEDIMEALIKPQENVTGKSISQLSNNQNTTEIGVSMEVEPSPSSSIRGGSEFHVFLSFRGKDMKDFTSHLYDELNRHGISTFIDSLKLQKGEEIDKLLEYIKRSKIFVPIFSIHYAESKWCLKEITESLECGIEIIPVFYGVEPSEVREQSGNFQYAFELHESNTKLKQEEVAKWREALKEVGGRSGFNLKDMNGDKTLLKLAIIQRVLDKVNRKPLKVGKHPVGIETRQLVKSLDNGGINGVHVVGIYGMGGLGKTTIARAVYNKYLTRGFNDSCCFLSNIREKSKQPNGLVDLQKQFIRDVFKQKDISLSDVAQGKILIRDKAKNKRVLLILDDIDSTEQLEALAGERDLFGSGSVIIITTRDKKVLVAYNVKEHEIYELTVLNKDQSRDLFL